MARTNRSEPTNTDLAVSNPTPILYTTPSFWFPPVDRRPTVSVVIPTLNEANNLPFVLPLIPRSVDEVIIVDGHSTDSTVEIARQLYPGVRIVMEQKRGKGAALSAGFKAATCDIIVMLDADGSTDPREIPAYVGALEAGADFAKGSRFMQGGGTSDMPLYRKLGNMAFTFLVRILFGGVYSDLLYGYNAFWARVLPTLDLDSSGFEVETQMNIRALCAGLKIAEIGSFETERVHGVGRLRAFPDGMRVLKTVIREWRRMRGMRGFHKKIQVGQVDEFTPAIQLLFREALHLARNRTNLSPQAYKDAQDTVRGTFRVLVSLPSEHPEIRQLQARYRQYYGKDLWAFFERLQIAPLEDESSKKTPSTSKGDSPAATVAAPQVTAAPQATPVAQTPATAQTTAPAQGTAAPQATPVEVVVNAS